VTGPHVKHTYTERLKIPPQADFPDDELTDIKLNVLVPRLIALDGEALKVPLCGELSESKSAVHPLSELLCTAKLTRPGPSQ